MVFPIIWAEFEQVIALAAQYSIPVICEWRESPVDSGLISYGTNLEDAFRQCGAYANEDSQRRKAG